MFTNKTVFIILFVFLIKLLTTELGPIESYPIIGMIYVILFCTLYILVKINGPPQ